MKTLWTLSFHEDPEVAAMASRVFCENADSILPSSASRFILTCALLENPSDTQSVFTSTWFQTAAVSKDASACFFPSERPPFEAALSDLKTKLGDFGHYDFDINENLSPYIRLFQHMLPQIFASSRVSKSPRAKAESYLLRFLMASRSGFLSRVFTLEDVLIIQ